ncbi:MAG: GatB/YqeY domain-containing protein [Pseudomonadota bacterium]
MSNAQSSLRQRLEEDMKSAMRAKDKERLGTIRLMLAAIKQREIDERITLDDAQIIAVLDKMTKQRRDSITQYEAAGRQDLADIEAAEIRVIQNYLPAALSETELDTMIQAAVIASGSVGPQDVGKVMAVLKPQILGRADMSLASRKVKNALATL